MSLAAGVAAYFAGGLFFSPYDYDHGPCELFGLTSQCYNFETQEGWCLMSWSLYLDNVGWAIAFLFVSLATVLLIPQKFRGLSISVAVPLHAIGWMKLIHVSFFARSFETYTAFPDWQIGVAALALGLSVILSADYLIYYQNHRERAIECRMGTLYNGLDLLTGEEFKNQ